jgi:predicted dehydrogenase
MNMMGEGLGARTGISLASAWSTLQREAVLRAGLTTQAEARLALVGWPLHKRPREAAEALRREGSIVVVRAPVGFTRRQAAWLERWAAEHRSVLVEWSASGRSRSWELGLGLDGTPETEKLVRIAATGVLYPRFGRSAHGKVLERYLTLLDGGASAPDARSVQLDEADPWAHIDESDIAAWAELLDRIGDSQDDFATERFRTAAYAVDRAASIDADIESGLASMSASEGIAPPRTRDRTARLPGRSVIVGAGMAAAIHAGIAGHHGTVTAIVARTSASAEGLASLHDALALTSVDRLGAADFMVVASPPGEHFAAAAYGIKAGLRVLVEKPLCANLADAECLTEIATEHDATLVYGENWPYRPWLVAAAAEMSRHAPEHVTIDCRWPHPTHGEYREPSYGGGVLFDSGSHALALARLVLNPGRVDTVSARLCFAEGHHNDVAAKVHLTFEGGHTASVQVSWQAPTPDVVACAGGYELRLAPTMSLHSNGRPVPVLAAAGGGPWVAGGSVGLHEVLAGLCDPLIPISTATEDLEVITACYASAACDGRVMRLPYAGNRSLTPAQTFRALSAAVP